MKKKIDDFTLRIIIQFGSDKEWDFDKISKSKKITEDFITRYKYEYGSNNHGHNTYTRWKEVLNNKPDFIDLYLKIVKKNDRSQYILSQYCKLNYIEKNLNVLNLSYMSKNLFITPKFIDKYIYERWDYKQLSKNPSITDDYIRKHINYRWDWSRICDIKRIINKERYTFMSCKVLNPDVQRLICEYL